MKGGIFEGIKRIYKSPNSLSINCIIFLIAVILSLIFTDAFVHIPKEIAATGGPETDKMFFQYLFIESPLSGIIAVILSYICGAYMINVIHNAIKISKEFLYGKSEAEEMPLLPDFTIKGILKPLPGIIILSLIWLILIYGCNYGFSLLITSLKANYLIAILIITNLLILPPLFSMIFTHFAENYEIKSSCNIVLIFRIFGKTFLPIWWLIIRYFGLSILVEILSLIVMVICAMLLFTFGQGPTLFITTTILIYTTMICTYAYYYGCAFIYSKKTIDKEYPIGELQ